LNRRAFAFGGYEHYKSKLYVQWVAHGSNIEAPKVLHTVGIKQLNDNPLYAFNLPSCVGNKECNTIEVAATHTYEINKFKISFTGIGEYEFVRVAL